MKLVNPLIDLGRALNLVQSPSRYIGGEYGSIVKVHKNNDDLFNCAIAFPDLYEIGMSNSAVKILYNALNKNPLIRCERVFAADKDFEALLKEKNIPLYTLETGMPLKNLDMIGFSIGYELGITQVLAMLELGGITLTSDQRREDEPLVIAGGCGVTNPAPIGKFFDAIFVGEAEDNFFKLIDIIAQLKKSGAKRSELLKVLDEHPNVWTKKSAQEGKIARRAVQEDFGLRASVPQWFPLANLKPVQDHGVVEIMRGCPNGCRFCHAGIYYRPQRIKNEKLIIDELDHVIFDAGYREVSLTSLSSADYPQIGSLLNKLNERYKGYNVSFQLPSLKVNSVSLPILESLSQVRKSGLTFAVETPEEAWQLSLNKEVYSSHLEEIIKSAKSKGWSSAKFYFMVGLPVGDYFGKDNPTGKTEEEAICDFLIELQAKTKIQCNVNVGVFIPKAHTPYQWVKQLTPEEAQTKIDYFYHHLPKGKFKLGRHNFNATILEGLISRGNEKVADVILSAYKKGARFDAWDDYLKNNMDFWKEAFSENNFDLQKEIYKNWDIDEKLPWESISLGSSKTFYKNEWEKSLKSVLTEKCLSDCKHPCGICNKKENVKVHTVNKVENISDSIKNNTLLPPKPRPEANIPLLYRVIFSFNRNNGGEYIAYLSQVEIFHKAFMRSGLEVVFTNGFNPLPRLEFANAMTLGIPSAEEIASCLMYEKIDEETFINCMNRALPDFFKISKAFIFPVTNLRKRESLSESLWGAELKYTFDNDLVMEKLFSSSQFCDFTTKGLKVSEKSQNSFTADIPFSLDKKIRLLIEELTGEKYFNSCTIKKLASYAKNTTSGWTVKEEKLWRSGKGKKQKNIMPSLAEENTFNSEYTSYFNLYEKIAFINEELIKSRAIYEQQKIDFYKEHPDVYQKHMENKNKNKSSIE